MKMDRIYEGPVENAKSLLVHRLEIDGGWLYISQTVTAAGHYAMSTAFVPIQLQSPLVIEADAIPSAEPKKGRKK